MLMSDFRFPTMLLAALAEEIGLLWFGIAADLAVVLVLI